MAIHVEMAISNPVGIEQKKIAIISFHCADK